MSSQCSSFHSYAQNAEGQQKVTPHVGEGCWGRADSGAHQYWDLRCTQPRLELPGFQLWLLSPSHKHNCLSLLTPSLRLDTWVRFCAVVLKAQSKRPGHSWLEVGWEAQTLHPKPCAPQETQFPTLTAPVQWVQPSFKGTGASQSYSGDHGWWSRRQELLGQRGWALEPQHRPWKAEEQRPRAQQGGVTEQLPPTLCSPFSACAAWWPWQEQGKEFLSYNLPTPQWN